MTIDHDWVLLLKIRLTAATSHTRSQNPIVRSSLYARSVVRGRSLPTRQLSIHVHL